MESASNDWASLIMKYLQQNIRAEEMSRLEQLMEKSPLFREQFELFANSNRFMQEIWEEEEFDADALWREVSSINRRGKAAAVKSISRYFPVIAAAAICLFIVSVALFAYFNRAEMIYPSLLSANGTTFNLKEFPKGYSLKFLDGTITVNDTMIEVNATRKNRFAGLSSDFVLSTPAGKRFLVKFSDGTVATLNAGSSVKFPLVFSKKSRDISISGEIFVDVKPNEHVPFIAKVNNATVEATGTSFSINAYDKNKIRTTLFEGEIKLFNAGKTISLAPGEQVVIGAKTFQPVPNPNIGRAIAWTQNYFDFNDMSVREMIHEIERWYDVKITVDNSVSEKKGGGKVSRSLTLHEVLNVLEICCDIVVRPGESERTFIVTASTKPNP